MRQVYLTNYHFSISVVDTNEIITIYDLKKIILIISYGYGFSGKTSVQ